MRNKLSIPWTSRLSSGRLFRWLRKEDGKDVGKRFPKEDDLDHLGALHSASMQSKKH